MKFKPLFLNISIISLKQIAICLLFISFISGCIETSVPIEGVHYERLPETLNSAKFAPITEVFSLTCAHCRKMEESIPAFERTLGQNISKMHIVFNQSAYVAAMLYYAAEMQTGSTPDYRFMIALFETMQTPECSSDEQQKAAMIEVFEARGLTSPINYDDQQFAELSRHVEMMESLSKQTKVESVPTFIVQGKFKVLSSAHRSREHLASTIKYLLAN